MNKAIKLKGAAAAVITVFKEDESIDGKGTINHVKWLLENGIQGLVVCGSSGESISMTLEERKRVAELVITEFKGEVPICIGTGEYRTKNTIELSKHAEKLRADSLLIILPYYMGATKIQVHEYYKEIAKNVNIPIIIYDNPHTCGISLDVKEIKAYFDEGLVNGVKLSSGIVSQVHDLRYLCGKDFPIFFGDDAGALEALLCGADGWISDTLNLMPKNCRELCDAAFAGERDKASKIWEDMLPLIQLKCFSDSNREPHWISWTKSGLKTMGRDVGKPRRPMLMVNEEHEKQLRILLSNLNK